MDEINVQQSDVLKGTESQTEETSTQEVESKQGEPSITGEPSKQGETPKGVETPNQLLTSEQVSKMIEKSLADERWKIRRSVEDKTRVEVERALSRANIAEETLSGFRGKIGELDPDVAKDIKLAEYESRDRAFQSVQQKQAEMEQQHKFHESFTSQINQFITGMGVDPGDKKIDWGEDAPNYLVKQQRILDSVAKIQKANLKDVEEKQSQVIKDVEAKIRKDLGLDSVDTSNPVAPRKDQSKYTATDWIKEGLREKQNKK